MALVVMLSDTPDEREVIKVLAEIAEYTTGMKELCWVSGMCDAVVGMWQAGKKKEFARVVFDSLIIEAMRQEANGGE